MIQQGLMRKAINPGAVLALVLLILIGGCDSVKVTRCFTTGAVASGSAVASEVGSEVFRRGGNAFDAAVAVGFALAVVKPQAGNIGGGGFAVVREGQTGQVAALDFRETAPKAAARDMYLNDSGEVIENLSTVGALSAGVPGTVAGLHALWEKYGTMPWEDLVTIAAELADTGFVVAVSQAEMLSDYYVPLSEFPETKTLLYPAGRPPQAGDRLVLKDLAGTLFLIAAEGPRAFYTGHTADQIVACMEKNGGLITAEDLEEYLPVWRRPVHFSFDSLDVYGMPPPSSGGIILGQMLKLLEPYDHSSFTSRSPEQIHMFCEAARLAYADRAEHLGDPEFYDNPSGLLDSTYLAERRRKLPLETAGVSADVRAGNPLKYESDQTTHFSVCDTDGNMVAITVTLNANFGSRLAVDGAGFLLNSEMDDFAIKPGHPNLWGLVGSEANKIESGKRMLSSMSPTLVLKGDRPFLVLGSRGGSKIITAVAQAIIDCSRFKLPLLEIMSRPRFHHQWLPDVIFFEKGGLTEATRQKLIDKGHEVRERSAYGGLHMIMIDASGLLCAVADPRDEGAVAGY
ncbi:MAG: gamma-glutamyltransferase [bacterium]|nr:gamma-glutamyltransferase [bacterium]